MPSLSATASALPRKAIGVLLQYPAPAEDAPAPAARTVLPGAKTPAVRKEKRGMKRRIEIGFVGAGNYASSMLLPHLAKLSAASGQDKGPEKVSR